MQRVDVEMHHCIGRPYTVIVLLLLLLSTLSNIRNISNLFEQIWFNQREKIWQKSWLKTMRMLMCRIQMEVHRCIGPHNEVIFGFIKIQEYQKIHKNSSWSHSNKQWKRFQMKRDNRFFFCRWLINFLNLNFNQDTKILQNSWLMVKQMLMQKIGNLKRRSIGPWISVNISDASLNARNQFYSKKFNRFQI